MATRLRVRALYVYPLKSAAGMRVAEATLDALGFVSDRRWMAVDADGGFLSQRRIPKMAIIQATPLPDDGLHLAAAGMPSLQVNKTAGRAQERDVIVWHDQVRALDGGDDAAAWLTQVLNCDTRLVYCPPARARVVDRSFASGSEQVGFADGFPLLVIGHSSLDEINVQLRERGQQQIGAERFRPNIVVEGAAPFEEDTWRQIVIGDDPGTITIDIVKPCARCSIISVDPRTGIQGVEPMRTLATFRRRGDAVYVGQNTIPRHEGCLVTGAPVRVVRRA